MTVKDKKPSRPAHKRAGLAFPVGRISRHLEKRGLGGSKRLATTFGGVLEYLAHNAIEKTVAKHPEDTVYTAKMLDEAVMQLPVGVHTESIMEPLPEKSAKAPKEEKKKPAKKVKAAVAKKSEPAKAAKAKSNKKTAPASNNNNKKRTRKA